MIRTISRGLTAASKYVSVRNSSFHSRVLPVEALSVSPRMDAKLQR